MGVRILRRRYDDPYGIGSETPPDWLLGNTGDWIEASFEIEASIEMVCTASEPVTINTVEKTIKLMSGKKWGDFGFDTDMDITLTFVRETITDGEISGSLTEIIELDAEQIFNDTLVYASNPDMDAIGYELIPTERATEKIKNVKFFSTKDIEGIRLKYQNVNNSDVESHNLNSFIDGTEQEAVYVGLHQLPDDNFVPMELIGMQSGMAIQKASIRKITTSQTVQQALMFYGTQTKRISVNASQRLRGAQTVMLNASGILPPFSGQTTQVLAMNNVNTGGAGNGTYTTKPSPYGCFIDNATESEAKTVKLKIQTKILNNDEAGNNRVLKLCIFRYQGNNFFSKQVLATYVVSNANYGITFVYDADIFLNVVAGDSYSLAYEYEFTNMGLTVRSVDFGIYLVNLRVFPTVNLVGVKKRYEVKLQYMLASFFENLESITNRQAPEVVYNASSLTDAIKIKMLPEWNNPNVVIQNDMRETERLGNTGWFDENFNGLPNDFVVKSVEYYDEGGTSTTALSYGTPVRVKAVIGGVQNMATSSRFKYGFIWIPTDEEDYKNKQTPFHKNTKINSKENESYALGIYPFTYQGFSNDGGQMDVSNVKFYQQGSDLVFEAYFLPNPAFMQFFEDRLNDRNYALWLSVADSALQENLSNRVSLLLDARQMELVLPIAGELPNVQNRFLEHPESTDMAGTDFYKGFLHDDVLANTNFRLKSGQSVNQIIMGYEVKNLATGQTFELERFVANTSLFVIDTAGIQQVDYTGTKGYKMASTNNKNPIKIKRDPNADNADGFAYNMLYPQKIRWEEWFSRTNVPNEYFNPALQNNGYNNNWLDYFRASQNHSINFFILFDVIENGGLLRYKNAFPIAFDGYDENQNLIKTHTYRNNSTNAIINVDANTGLILSNEYTKVEITYEKTNGNFDLSNVYAVMTLEISNGTGAPDERYLSSILDSENDNILIPLANETRLKVELIAPNKIKTTALIDYERLQPASSYDITGRIGCFKNDNGTPIIERLFENLFEQKFE